MILIPLAEEVLLRFPQLLARLYVEPHERLLRFFFAARVDELQELVIDSLPSLLHWELLQAQLTVKRNVALGFSASLLNHFRLYFQIWKVLQNQILTQELWEQRKTAVPNW